LTKQASSEEEKKLRDDLLHILYHGTSKENAEKILKEGFDQYTYFAKNLTDALSMGGPYVFAVAFKHTTAPQWFEYYRSWQIRNKRKIHPCHIISLAKYSEKRLYFKKELAHKVLVKSLRYYHKVEAFGP